MDEHKEVHTQQEDKGKNAMSPIAIVVGLVIAAAIIYGAYTYFQGKDNAVNIPNTDTVQNSLDAKYANQLDTTDSTVVATVNGTTITRGELNKNINTVLVANKIMFSELGAEEQKSLESSILESRINQQVLLSAAATAGLQVDEAAVEAELNTIETELGGREAFEEQIGIIGMTIDEFRAQIGTDLLIAAYIGANQPEITVTDEEAQQVYDEFVQGNEAASSTPDFSEVKEEIKATIMDQKQQAWLAAHVEELRAATTISVEGAAGEENAS